MTCSLLATLALVPLGHHGASSDPLPSPGHPDTKSTPFSMEGPGWFSAISCNIWIRWEHRPVDSAWLFGMQLCYFQPRGRFWGPQIPNVDPSWAGDRFLATNGARKNTVLWKKWFPMRFYRDLCEGNGLYGTQEAFGQGRFPPNPPRNLFFRPPRISDQFGGPLGLHGGSLLSLCGPIGPYCPHSALGGSAAWPKARCIS